METQFDLLSQFQHQLTPASTGMLGGQDSLEVGLVSHEPSQALLQSRQGQSYP